VAPELWLKLAADKRFDLKTASVLAQNAITVGAGHYGLADPAIGYFEAEGGSTGAR
jgi:hypothetical protein